MGKYFLMMIILLSCRIYGEVLEVPAEYSDIQSAINASQDGDTVLVAPGTYYENINFNGKNILVTSNFLVTGDFSPVQSTIINGSSPSHPDTASCVRIISGEDSTAVLQGFTLTGGRGTKWKDEHGPGTYYEGGAIIVALSSPVIRNNIIIDNEAVRRPAGISSAGGGGIRCGDGNPQILNNIIMNNSAMYGGGIVFNYCTGIIRNNIIINNRVFQAVPGAPTYGGGGIWLNGSGTTTIVENNTITGNTVSGSGSSGAAGRGGGILKWGLRAVCRNNIVWNNTQLSGTQLYNVSGLIVAEYNNVEDGYAGTGNISADPLIDTLTYMLSGNSPCIDAGDSSAALNDPEDPGNPGLAAYPSLGSVRNDMGAFGGPGRILLPGIPAGTESLPVILRDKDFQLYQNFPNPFNPFTKIRWNTAVKSWQSLKVYDLLGKEITTLVNELKQPGVYEIEFSGSNLASGIYFYQLRSVPEGERNMDFIQTRCMIILK